MQLKRDAISFWWRMTIYLAALGAIGYLLDIWPLKMMWGVGIFSAILLATALVGDPR